MALRPLVGGGPIGAGPVDGWLQNSAAATVAVSADLAGAYSVRVSASSDLPGSYSVLQTVGEELAGSYPVLSAVFSSLSGSYSVLQTVGEELDGSYQTLILASSSLPGSYLTLAPVLSELAGSYAVLTVVGAAQAGAYTVLSFASLDLSGSYGVVSRVGKDLLGAYRVGQTQEWYYVNHQDPMSPMTLGGVHVPAGGLTLTERNPILDRFGNSARLDIYLNGELQDVVSAGPYPPPKAALSRTFLVGDGLLSVYILNHSLGTRDVTVEVYLSTDPFPEDSGAEVEHTDPDFITVTFPSPPAPGSRRVVVQG